MRILQTLVVTRKQLLKYLKYIPNIRYIRKEKTGIRKLYN